MKLAEQYLEMNEKYLVDGKPEYMGAGDKIISINKVKINGKDHYAYVSKTKKGKFGAVIDDPKLSGYTVWGDEFKTQKEAEKALKDEIKAI